MEALLAPAKQSRHPARDQAILLLGVDPGLRASEMCSLKRRDAAKALILDKLFGEVAFANQASRANALGLMLLPFVQRTIDGFTPLHLFDAPTQSSGKTYAAQICIAPFREVAPSAYKRNTEENQKELFARLLGGPSHVLIDNITGDLSDPTLATAITEKYLDGRVMGVGRTEVVSTRVVWVGTSNNAQLCSDALSRSMLIRLDTKKETPKPGSSNSSRFDISRKIGRQF